MREVFRQGRVFGAHVLLALLAGSGLQAHAGETSATNFPVGVNTAFSAIYPPSGGTEYDNYNLFYKADKYVASAGNPAPPLLRTGVFVEATSNMARTRGRAPNGKRLVCAVPHGHWHITTFLCGLRAIGLVAPLAWDGAINGASSCAYVEQLWAPTLTPGDIVVLYQPQLAQGERVNRPGNGALTNLGAGRVGCIGTVRGELRMRRASFQAVSPPGVTRRMSS